jgi:hypothetical protein
VTPVYVRSFGQVLSMLSATMVHVAVQALHVPQRPQH